MGGSSPAMTAWLRWHDVSGEYERGAGPGTPYNSELGEREALTPPSPGTGEGVRGRRALGARARGHGLGASLPGPWRGAVPHGHQSVRVITPRVAFDLARLGPHGAFPFLQIVEQAFYRTRDFFQVVGIELNAALEDFRRTGPRRIDDGHPVLHRFEHDHAERLEARRHEADARAPKGAAAFVPADRRAPLDGAGDP